MSLKLPASRPAKFENRYRLYLDESGDHVFRNTSRISHRYLCLLGCWFRNPEYLEFHHKLETLKAKHLPHHPDNPVVLHREDMIHARKAFKVLRNAEKRATFDNDLLKLIQDSNFHMVAVVIDKDSLKQKYGDTASHPYHLGLGFLLQRYAGYLNHINRVGDVMAEARGGKEDKLLRDSYQRVYEHGIWGITSSDYFQTALTSQELKIKSKTANIAGLQLADLLGHPAKMWALKKEGLLDAEIAPFAKRIMEVSVGKFNHHLYNAQIKGYGYVLYP